MNIRRTLILALAIFIVFIWQENCSYADMRALWATRFQMDSREKIDKLVKDAKDNGFDTLITQVLGRGVAYYDSKLIPKMDLGFDPLAYTVEKSHSAGLKVHAWLNTYYVWSSPEPPAMKDHVVNKHPEWLIYEGNSKFLNPGLREVQDHIYAIYLEVAEKYDVDGIHFDYVRYPNEKSGLDAGTRRLFSNSYWIDPLYLLKSPYSVIAFYGRSGFYKLMSRWTDFRCDRVSLLVRRISAGIRGLDKDIKISAAVFPDIRIAREEKGQDWLSWLREGSIDFAVPMIYSAKHERVKRLIRNDAVITRGKSIVIGLGAYMVSPEALVRQIRSYQEYRKKNGSLNGICLFSYDSLSADPMYLAKIKQDVF